MVIQRDVNVPVWGTADAGTSINVMFGEQRARTNADDKGRWSVKLEAMKADAEPRELKVTVGDATLTVRDVLVGEVWVAAGQSNMEWPLANEAHAKAELPAADHPKLRLLNLNYAGQSTAVFGPDVLQRLTPDGYSRGAWQPCSPRSAKDFSAVGYYFGKELHQTLKVPVGIIHLAVGGSPTEAWVRREALAADKDLAPLPAGNWLDNESLEGWCRQRGRDNLATALKGKADVPKDEAGPNHPFKPGFLWDAGICRLIPFAVRGVLWYQGESNSLSLARVQQHDRLFPLLVADWRKRWGLGEFPFVYCQLSSIGTEKGYKSQHWPEFRDGQRRMLAEIPNSGMAVTSDLGHPTDVHPRNKKEVGRRLALWALARTYDQKVVSSGPLAKSVRRDGPALIVTFDHADGLKASDGKPVAGFEIAGADGKLKPAGVEIQKDGVTLTSRLVAEPVSARYGWQPSSTGNLTNGEGLPASTFLLTLPRK
jgi:sialate O-acetylesterase